MSDNDETQERNSNTTLIFAMTASVLSIIESPTHPKLADLYRQCGLQEFQVNSTRNAMKLLKKEQPDYIVAEFFYGYGNNYAGVNVSNLDTVLSSIPKYSPCTKVVVLVSKDEAQYVEKLEALFPIHAVFVHPLDKTAFVKVFE